MTEQNLEQPSLEKTAEVNEPIIEENMGAATDSQGSNLGKFKDATSLYEAYKALEKEFTRKSQKLAELSRQVETEKTQNEVENSEIPPQNALLEENKQNLTDQTNLNKPLYLRPDWQKKVNGFLSQNPESKEHFSAIAKILLDDRQLAASENCLAIAYKLATKDQISPASLDNPKTIDFLKRDERVKDAVIKDYLLSLKSQPPIRFISGESNTTMLTPTQGKPKNLKEASNMFKKLLEL